MTEDITQIIADYKPAKATLQHLEAVNFVAVVGPIGVGKTTLIDAAIKKDASFQLVVGDTSRQPRSGEHDGVDYHFRTKAAMLARIRQHEYVQVPPDVTGDLYATAPENYARVGIATMAVWAEALPQFRALPFKSMHTIFVLPPNFEIWQTRLAARTPTPEIFGQRLREARYSLQFACKDAETGFVINDDLETATAHFLLLARGRQPVSKMNAGQIRGRQLAAALLAQLFQSNPTYLP